MVVGRLPVSLCSKSHSLRSGVHPVSCVHQVYWKPWEHRHSTTVLRYVSCGSPPADGESIQEKVQDAPYTFLASHVCEERVCSWTPCHILPRQCGSREDPLPHVRWHYGRGRSSWAYRNRWLRGR